MFGRIGVVLAVAMLGVIVANGCREGEVPGGAALTPAVAETPEAKPESRPAQEPAKESPPAKKPVYGPEPEKKPETGLDK